MAETRGVLVVDFGAQYAQLIARRVREANVFSEIVPSSITAAEVTAKNPSAIILSGGPSSVYAENAPKVDAAIFALGIPVFGICRGLQIMAVAHGGSLHQHLPDVVGNTLHRDAPGTFNDHGATFTPGSLIADLVGATEVTVNSSHHQAVDSPGDLTITGYAEDGTVEVCEDPSAEFVLGVQWHPEFSDDEKVSENLFRAFVKVCANR